MGATGDITTHGTGEAGIMTRGTGDIPPYGGTHGSIIHISGERHTFHTTRTSTITAAMTTSTEASPDGRTDTTGTGLHPDPAREGPIRQETVHQPHYQELHPQGEDHRHLRQPVCGQVQEEEASRPGIPPSRA